MTVWSAICCPDCLSNHISKNRRSPEGKQRYRCNNSDCIRCTFILDYTYQEKIREKKEQMIEMSLSGSEIRDIARVLKVSSTTVINELKKKKQHLKSVNEKALNNLNPEEIEIGIYKVEEENACDDTGCTFGVKESEVDVPMLDCISLKTMSNFL